MSLYRYKIVKDDACIQLQMSLQWRALYSIRLSGKMYVFNISNKNTNKYQEFSRAERKIYVTYCCFWLKKIEICIKKIEKRSQNNVLKMCEPTFNTSWTVAIHVLLELKVYHAFQSYLYSWCNVFRWCNKLIIHVKLNGNCNLVSIARSIYRYRNNKDEKGEYLIYWTYICL